MAHVPAREARGTTRAGLCTLPSWAGPSLILGPLVPSQGTSRPWRCGSGQMRMPAYCWSMHRLSVLSDVGSSPGPRHLPARFPALACSLCWHSGTPHGGCRDWPPPSVVLGLGCGAGREGLTLRLTCPVAHRGHGSGHFSASCGRWHPPPPSDPGAAWTLGAALAAEEGGLPLPRQDSGHGPRL